MLNVKIVFALAFYLLGSRDRKVPFRKGGHESYPLKYLIPALEKQYAKTEFRAGISSILRQDNIDIAKTDMKKAYTFRIYPNKNQEVIPNRTLSTCRHLYNDALAERRRQAELNRLEREFQVFTWDSPEWISYEDQQNDLPESKTPYQKEVYSQVLQNVLKRLDRSFQNFSRGNGYPRFKGRNRYNTFTYPQSGFEIKKVYVTSKIGIDVGLESLLTLSNGEQIDPPKFLRQSEEKLIWEQRKLSKKKLGSKNRNKQRVKVARVQRKIRNQRKDFAHKTGKMLVNTYDRIVFEKLHIQNMVQNHCLAKSISDAGWGQVISLTRSKAEEAGKSVIQVNANETSQTCVCGYPVPKDLSVRVHSCPHCGLELKRDHVSAILIRNRDNVGSDCTEFTPVEIEPILCR
jgi:putative transposase